MLRPLSFPKDRKDGDLPYSLELSILFKDFIAYWTGWEISLAEEAGSPHLPQPMEARVSLRGPVQGTLSIRTSSRLIEKLFERLVETGKDPTDASSAFREMTAHYAAYLVQTLWKDLLLDLGPILARLSGGEKGPSFSQCHTFCGLQVQGEPLEIRFWSEKDPGRIP